VKVEFTNRFNFIKCLPTLENTVCISINDTNTEVAAIESLVYNDSVDVHIFKFYDDDESFTLGNALDIREILEDAHIEHKDVLVHCYMGVSRSTTIARFAEEYLGLELGLKDYKCFNKHMSEVFDEVFRLCSDKR
jgi:predicted protein tyrosine phosphatase